MFPIPENQIGEFPPYLSYEQMNVINAFRFLTMQLAIWTRALITALKFQTDGVNEIYTKLHEVPIEIYDAMTTFYGAQAAEQFVNLLRQHVIILRDITVALLNNDGPAATDLLNRWYLNSEETADFFARLSPYWSKEQWKYLLDQYIQLLYHEIITFIQGDYKQSIQIFDRTLYQSILMADYASKGLIQNLQ